MNIIFELTNIVLLYKKLEQSQISTDALRQKFNGEEPKFAQIDPIIVSTFSKAKAEIIIIVPEKRLEIKVTNPTDEDLANLVTLANTAVTSISNPEYLAYGINLFASAEGNEEFDYRKFVLANFLTPIPEIVNSFKPGLLTLAPQYYFSTAEKRYQLGIVPDINAGTSLKIALNIHYDNTEFLTRDELAKTIADEKRELTDYFRKLN